MESKKTTGRGLTAAMALTAVLCAIALSTSADAAPGSETDPVVTKSYVDQKINETLATIGNAGGAAVGPAIEVPANSFTPVQLDAGQTIIAGEGCEMILRSGQGVIVTATETVVNVTTGSDMKDGANVPKGHLLIFPRDDGRGIRADSMCWFIVKGNFTIK